MNSFEAKRVQSPESVDYTPATAVAAGEVIVQGTTVGIASNDIAANDIGSLQLEGIFDVKKASGSGVTFAIDAVVDWDTVANTAIATGGGGDGVPMGRCVSLPAADGDTFVRVLLNRP